jgi:hypothetical protein
MAWRHQWARKDLQRGDLSALLELTSDSRWDDPNPACVRRLNKRGFIKKRSLPTAIFSVREYALAGDIITLPISRRNP